MHTKTLQSEVLKVIFYKCQQAESNVEACIVYILRHLSAVLKNSPNSHGQLCQHRTPGLLSHGIHDRILRCLYLNT